MRILDTVLSRESMVKLRVVLFKVYEADALSSLNTLRALSQPKAAAFFLEESFLDRDELRETVRIC